MQNVGYRVLRSDFFWTGMGVLAMLFACGLIAAGLLTLSAPLVVAMFLALMVAGVIMGKPHWGILAFLALVYLRPESYIAKLGALRLPLLLSSLTFFAWLVQLLLKRETFRWRTELGWMIGFAVTMVLSAFMVPGNDMTVRAATEAAKMVMLFLLIQQMLNTESRMKLGLNCLLLCTVGLSISSIRVWFSGGALMEHGQARAILNGGEFDDPNDLAAALVPLVPVALLVATRAAGAIQRFLGAAGLAILVFGVYLTNSRGGMLALGVALAVFLIYRVGWTKGCILGAIVVGLMFVFGPDRFSANNIALAEGDDSAMGRILAWEAGLQMFERSPIIGVGYDQFEMLYKPVPAAHNSFLQGLSEGGLLNAFCWVGLHYWSLLTLIRLRRLKHAEDAEGSGQAYAAALLAGLLASLTAGIFLSRIYVLNPLIPVAFAAAISNLGGEAMRPSFKRDWPHYLAVIGVVLASVAASYAVVKAVL